MYTTDYVELCSSLQALIHGVPHLIADLANASALIYDSVKGLNWVGFYTVSGNGLVLGPFQGKPACIEIAYGKGVCGTALMKDEVIAVDDVHLFEGHIACDSASESEIVIPIHNNGKVVAVLDIDSPHKHRFSNEDKDGLTEAARIIEEELCDLWA